MRPEGASGKISCFFRQTFRHHTGAEYSELLTRGLHDDKGVNRKYPWAYVRVFTIALILFAVFVLIARFVSQSAAELFAPTIIVLAAVCVNLPFLIFLYELYPERDLSFITVCIVMLFGGAGAHIVAQILFDLFPVSDAWLKAIISGFFEELPKAASAIICILIARKRSPLAGFVLGAAVGCGFSIAEDMGYIFVETNGLPIMNLNTIITVAAERGITALCTHTLWTAAIGWSYCLFNKWISNAAFYLMLVLSCGLHICWDMPLGGVGKGFLCGGCVVVAVLYTVLIYYFGRRKVYRAAATQTEDGSSEEAEAGKESNGCESGDTEYFEEDGRSLNASTPEYWSYWGRLAVALGAFLMSVIAIIYCSISFPEVYGVEKFSSPEQLITFMQDGVDLDGGNRPYIERMGNYSTDYEKDENGVERIVKVTQKETPPNQSGVQITYFYEYSANYDSLTDRYYYFPLSVSAEFVNADGLKVTKYREVLYCEGQVYATFFRIRDDVTNFTFDQDGDVTVYTYNPGFVRDLTEPRYLWLFATFAAIFGASCVCYVALKIVSWRVKKLCSTKDVSSAE